jgi:hypothetical protein
VTLYLSCALCGRKQAAGLLSHAAWGQVWVENISHRVCPVCREEHRDWESRVHATLTELGLEHEPPQRGERRRFPG